MLLQLIAKEVAVLKKKVISMLYVYTEESYEGSESRNLKQQEAGKGFYSTRVSLQLLQVLGEPKRQTHQTMLRMRARHVRDKV